MNMRDKKSIFARMAMTLIAMLTTMTALADAEPVQISDADSWCSFARRVSNGETNLYAVMTADVDLGSNQTMIGTNENPYEGRFDGRGHKLTVHYSTSESNTAPFRHIKGARIYNLHTAGTIETSGQFAAGIVAQLYGERACVMNCRSSVTITSSLSGDGTHGGLVAVIDGATFDKPSIAQCLFDGKLLTTNGTGCCGGLVGYAHKFTSYIDCLYAPAEIEEGETEIQAEQTICRHAMWPTIRNCCYTRRLGDSQGDDVSGKTAEEVAAKLGSHWHVENGRAVPIYDRTMLEGDGTERVPFIVKGIDDWNTLAYAVSSGYRMLGLYVKLTTDITVTTPVGEPGSHSASKPDFSGFFDGQGHTMTLDMSSDADHCAPFNTGAGDIHNLHVTGTIRTSGRYAGGIVGYSHGSSNVFNCRSSVTIISSYKGEAHHGGLVGYNDWGAAITITNCLFDGKLLTDGGTTNCSGIIGVANNHLTVNTCLAWPADPAEGETPCGSCNSIYVINDTQYLLGATDNYYKPASNLATLQGNDASGFSQEELMEKLGDAWHVTDGILTPITKIIPLVGSGAANDPYLIRNADDWKAFADNVAAGSTYFKENFLMTDDIDLGDDQSMIGNSKYGFAGNFDGGGHTLTVHYVSDGDFCAPFRYLKQNDHRFKNLHTAGTITTSGKSAAGLIGANAVYWNYVGQTNINNCRSSVTIISSTKGEGWHGGLVGEHHFQLVMENCLFDGSILGPDTKQCGGLLGINKGNSVRMDNCLYNPKEQTVSADSSFTLGLNSPTNHYNKMWFSNCYYTSQLGTAQGTDGSQMTGEELAAALGGGWTLEDGWPVPRVPELGELSGSGSEADPYIIATSEDWRHLSGNVESGINYEGKHLLQTADITVSSMVGTESHPFNGIYDGGGHRLTFNAGSEKHPFTSEYCAPFRHVSGATVQHLYLDGTIHTAAKFAGGIAANTEGSFTVTDCINSTTIASTVDGDGTHGGFVARVNHGTSTFTNCVFNGHLLGEKTHHCGGFAGWVEARNDAKASFTNCLFVPASYTLSYGDNHSYARSPINMDALSYSNSYIHERCEGLDVAQGEACVRVRLDDTSLTKFIYDEGAAFSEGSKWHILPLGIGCDSVAYVRYQGSVKVGFINGKGSSLVSFICDTQHATFDYAASNPATLTVDGYGDVNVGAVTKATPWAGEGTADNPYVIISRDQLNLLATQVSGGTTYEDTYFVLGSDIAYRHTTDWDDDSSTETNFKGIGHSSSQLFKGYFDGRGHTISGLRMYYEAEDGWFVGLFGYLSGGKVSNVILSDTRITAYYAAGGIAGCAYDALIENCHVTGSVCIHSVVDKSCQLGGIIGFAGETCTVSGCVSAARVTAAVTDKCDSYGGIAGENEGTVKNCLALGVELTAVKEAYGAIIGKDEGKSLDHNYYSACTVGGTAKASPVGRKFSQYSLTDNDAAVEALRDGADNSAAIALLAAIPEQFGTYKLALDGRTLYDDGSWNTLCLPFDMTAEQMADSPLAGATVKELDTTTSGISDGTLTLNFTDAPAIVAGKPYIVKWESEGDGADLVFAGVAVRRTDTVAVAAADSMVTFRGSYSPVAIGTEGDMLCLDHQSVWTLPGEDMLTGAFRACLLLDRVKVADAAESTCMVNGDGSVTFTLPVERTIIDYTRTLEGPADEGDVTVDSKAACLYTVCLPFVPETTGMKYYTLSGVNGSVLTFDEVAVPQANTPYVVSVTAATAMSSEVAVADLATAIAEAGPFNGYTLKGTFTDMDNAEAEGLYILQRGGRWGKVPAGNGGVYIPAFRAYIEGPASGARELGSAFGGGSTAAASLRLVDRSGSEHWYDLNGRRITAPTRKGIYIDNGKKIIK